jgi:two-component system, NarL family, sensor histidine kinase DesK
MTSMDPRPAPSGPGSGRPGTGLAERIRDWHEPCLSDAARKDFTRTWRGFAGVFLVFLVQPLVELWQDDSIPGRVIGIGLLLAFIWLYMVVAPQAVFGGPRRLAVSALGAMTAICVLYLLVCGAGGVTLLPYLAVVGALVVPARLAPVLVVALAAAGTWLPPHVQAWEIDQPLWGVGAGVLIAGAVAVIMRFNAGQADELDMAREEIAELGAGQERLRIARDLHDLLGHALTTVTVKAELASRLVEIDPQRAAAEMREVAALSRDSLADVRATVAGYREMSLAAELATARQILDAAGIEADLPASTEVVAGELRELFGWTLREGVTNAVRHSRARHVEVRFEPRAIAVVNDGVAGPDTTQPDAPATVEAGGHGLAGLRERAAKAGAQLEAGPIPPDRYRLRVEAVG